MWMHAVVIVVALVGCGKKEKTPTDLMNEYRPKLEAMKAKLVALKPVLDKAESVALPAKLDPPLAFTGTDGATGNTIIYSYSVVDDPAQQPIGSIPPSDLMMSLYWAARPVSDDGDTALMTKVFESGLATRYVIVIRDLESVAPKLLDAETFAPGYATARVYVYDLVGGKLVGSVELKATTPPEVKFRYSTDAGANSAAMSALHDSIRADLKAKVTSMLKGLGDVRFVY